MCARKKPFRVCWAALRRTLIVIMPLFLLDATCTFAWAKKATRVGVLLGAQHNPPVETGARGAARFIYDSEGRVLFYEIVYSGLSSAETVAHIHGPAGPGENGGVLHPLPPGSPKRGVWEVPPELEEAVLSGLTYVNIHTSMHPSGEIRAQMTDLAAIVTSDQEVPPNESAASGWGVFNLDVCNKRLEYYVVVDGLESMMTGAHIHGLALHLENAGVLHPLPTSMTMSGTWDYWMDDVTAHDLLNGLTYVNVHTVDRPSGEIRGQIVSAVVALDGEQEVPPVKSPGSGVGLIGVFPSRNVASYRIGRANMTSAETAAHIHGPARRGSTAGVLHPLPPGPVKLGQWEYGEDLEEALTSGRTYVNIHTEMFGSGELRGQIELAFPPCDGDVNCDGQVDTADLLAVLSAWGDCPGCPEDLDGDGMVATSDLLIVLANWGPC